DAGGRRADQLTAAGWPARRRRRDDRLARPAGQRRRQRPDGAGLRPVHAGGVMTRTELAAPPNMAQLFAKAALTTRGRGGDLPATRLARTGVQVDPGELAAYARVCRFDLANELPVTYPHVLAFPLQLVLMSDRAFPLALPGFVHVRNRLEQVRSI